MKALLLTLTFAALAACPVLLSSCGSAAPPAPADWNRHPCQYVPLSSSERGKLQRALRDCATLELSRHNFVSEEPQPWTCTLRRGEGLEPILAELAAVPYWYVADYGDCPPMVNPMVFDDVRFLDAEGEEIYDPNTLIFEPCCPTAEGKRKYLSEFLPFPKFKNPFE